MAHHHALPAPANSDQRWLGVALAVTGVLVVVEVVAGLLTGSIALLSDAGHNVTDAASIGIALVAARLALRPPSGGLTFGLRRMEILSAQINGAMLLVLAGVIAFESFGRLLDPPDIDAAPVIVVGVLGGVANGAAAWALSRATRQSLNVRGAAQHVLADLYGSVAAVAAGVAVVAFGFLAADPLAALVVVGLMVHAGWGLLRDSGRILLEAAPQGMDVEAVGDSMSAVPGVVEIHDLHVWEITSGFPALAAHVLVAPGEDCHAARRTLESILHDRFALEHTTLQVDHAPRDGDLLDIAPLRPR